MFKIQSLFRQRFQTGKVKIFKVFSDRDSKQEKVKIFKVFSDREKVKIFKVFSDWDSRQKKF